MDVILFRECSFTEMSAIVCFRSKDMRLRLITPHKVSNSVSNGVSRVTLYAFAGREEEDEVQWKTIVKANKTCTDVGLLHHA